MARVTPRLISLKVGAVDRSDEISTFTINAGAADNAFVTFADAKNGGKRDYTASLRVAQDHASATLWDLVWTLPGSEIAGIYAPHGNAVPSVLQPHFTFTAIVSEPDGTLLGAEATADPSAVAVVDLVWKLKAKPVKVTAP